MIDMVFLILLELAKLVTGTPKPGAYMPQPLSPEARMACAKLDEITAQVTLLGKYKIHTQPELEAFISERTSQISALGKDRQQLWNKLKTEESPHRECEIRVVAKDITARIKTLRKELKTAENTLDRAEYYRELLRIEYAMEAYYLYREKASVHRIRDMSPER